ncbi:MAG: hypothetical protein WBC44_11400 [Planctomycetaceae bacterium]
MPADAPSRVAFRSLLLSLVLPFVWTGQATASEVEYEHESIGYATATPHNAVSRLQERIAQGDAQLEYDDESGWLQSLLKELDVDTSSQMLVYSKTSLQRSRIAPRTPRAIYFTDDVYVGFCKDGEVIEVTAVDPDLGAVFYTVDQENRSEATLLRQTDNCLICHASSAHTGGVPGHVVRSVYSDAGGLPVLSAGSFRIDQQSPLEERWGGWYVTGTHGDQKHLGNLIVRDKTKPEQYLPENLNVTDISDRLDLSAYPSTHSDIIALMVMEHQTGTHNKIIQANFAAKRALWDEKVLDEAFGEGGDELRDSTTRRIANAAESLVEYLLFSDEAKLTAPIAGTSGFAETFMGHGVRDSKGRSLRDLDLTTRMFKYPCSYLIYSDAFEGLPESVKAVVYRRLHEVLTGQGASEEFSHLSVEDRTAILEILLETKQGLPGYWTTLERKAAVSLP